MSLVLANHGGHQTDTGSTDTQSWTPTAGSSRKLLVYACLTGGGTNGVRCSGVTANGVAMTAITGTDGYADVSGVRTTGGQWFYLDETNFWSGAQNIVATYTAVVRARVFVVELSGAKQGAVDAVAKNNNIVGTTTLSATITTVAANAMILVGGLGASNTPTLDSPTTTLDTLSGNANGIALDGDFVLATPGAQALGITWNLTFASAGMALVSIAPASTSLRASVANYY